MDNETLVCPYCGREQYTHEPDEISGAMCLTECEQCEKEFWYCIKVTREYWSYKGEDQAAT